VSSALSPEKSWPAVDSCGQPQRPTKPTFAQGWWKTHAGNRQLADFCAHLVENVRIRPTARSGKKKAEALLPALHLDRLNSSSSRQGIKVSATDLDRFQIIVQVVHQRDAGRDVEAYDSLIAHLVQMLDDRAQ
jgi:hypothetical protein